MLTALLCFLLLAAATSANDSSLRSIAWYAGWQTGFPLSQVSWSKYTQLTYAFATTTPDVNTLFLADSDKQLLPQFVQMAHQNNVKAALSIGGWGGSQFFSTNVGSAENRTAFVKTVTTLAQNYSLDGLDFDWEFPGSNSKSIGCNTANSNDTSNFLSFLQELRQDSVGSKLILSAATYVLPWNDTTGTPLTDVSPFGQVLDFIAIMNYDVYNTLSNHAGPNSPLSDSCAPSSDQIGSAMSAVKAWTDAKMPASQILLGIASYGHSFVASESDVIQSASSSNITNIYPPFNLSSEHLGDIWDGIGGVDFCGNFSGPSGVYNYWGLVDEGYINVDGTPQSGIAYVFDNCSQTPFVYNKSNQTFISFDNPESFALKGAFIKNSGLGGFSMWDAAGDLNDTLIDAIRTSCHDLGFLVSVIEVYPFFFSLLLPPLSNQSSPVNSIPLSALPTLPSLSFTESAIGTSNTQPSSPSSSTSHSSASSIIIGSPITIMTMILTSGVVILVSLIL
ncbi:glycoside hydrolase superfamily [Rhodocollybia butyracea]|uniref:Glycoside hydrolase superfamily n=1 Tax=Rhodocollybia butyracea TaxID=206335 RepID=A0A9P5U202_9AGAR|nr:glycoside hydrolase superfamily [Rhodocollybia butyracea]